MKTKYQSNILGLQVFCMDKSKGETQFNLIGKSQTLTGAIKIIRGSCDHSGDQSFKVLLVDGNKEVEIIYQQAF